MWRNWAGDQQCVPEAIDHPSTGAELRAALERAREAGRRVRVAASGHSFTDIACTDGHMLRLEGMNRLLDVDRGSGLVKVEAGIGLRDLSEQLYDNGLALENMGDIDIQTLAGAISTGTHGTGARFGNISSQIEAMELMLADGTIFECSAASDPETLQAARVGLGALGVIVTVTLRCVPAFTIDRLDHPRPLQETLERLDELADSNDHFEFYTLPHSEIALLRESKRGDWQPKPHGRARTYLEEVVLENRVFDLMARVGRRFPGTIPTLNRAISRVVGRSRKIDRSYRVYGSKRLVRFTEMEYGIPREAGAEAVRRVLEVIDRRDFAVGFPLEVRFVAPDDAYLSPSNGRDTCYIAVHMYRGMEWYPYFRAVEAIMTSYDGRPHWGKRHFQSEATLAPRYPDWDRFQEVRSRLDPQGVFGNEYIDRVLGSTESSGLRRDTSGRGRLSGFQIRDTAH
jgi:L-gulonolactone oxidase